MLDLFTKVTSPVLKILDRAIVSLNAIGSILIILMMALICSDVLARNLMNSAVPGVVELTELGIVSIVFLQISDALRSGKLMRSDGLLKIIQRRLLKVGFIANCLMDATGAVLFYFIANSGFGRFHEAWAEGYYIGNLGAFTAPTWPMELSVALGSALIAILFLVNSLRNLGAFFGIAQAPASSTAQPN